MLEGDSGVGKSELINALLDGKGIKPAEWPPHPESDEIEGQPSKQKYYKIDASFDYETKKAIITQAYEEGNIVWIDEINSCIDDGLEKILNLALTGEHPDGSKDHASDVKPGFMLISSINSMGLEGRSEISPALRHRTIQPEVKGIKDYGEEDLQKIVKHWLERADESVKTEIVAKLKGSLDFLDNTLKTQPLDVEALKQTGFWKEFSDKNKGNPPSNTALIQEHFTKVLESERENFSKLHSANKLSPEFIETVSKSLGSNIHNLAKDSEKQDVNFRNLRLLKSSLPDLVSNYYDIYRAQDKSKSLDAGDKTKTPPAPAKPKPDKDPEPDPKKLPPKVTPAPKAPGVPKKKDPQKDISHKDLLKEAVKGLKQAEDPHASESVTSRKSREAAEKIQKLATNNNAKLLMDISGGGGAEAISALQAVVMKLKGVINVDLDSKKLNDNIKGKDGKDVTSGGKAQTMQEILDYSATGVLTKAVKTEINDKSGKVKFTDNAQLSSKTRYMRTEFSDLDLVTNKEKAFGCSFANCEFTNSNLGDIAAQKIKFVKCVFDDKCQFNLSGLKAENLVDCKFSAKIFEKILEAEKGKLGEDAAIAKIADLKQSLGIKGEADKHGFYSNKSTDLEEGKHASAVKIRLTESVGSQGVAL